MNPNQYAPNTYYQQQYPSTGYPVQYQQPTQLPPQPQLLRSEPSKTSIVPITDVSGDGVNYESNLRIVETMKGSQSFVEVHEFKRLRGVPELFHHISKTRVVVPNIINMQGLYFAAKTGIHLKQVKIVLKDSYCRMEAGAMHYMKGNIEIEAKIGGVGKAIGAILTKETIVKPKYKGTGEIYLEPSYGYFALVYLQSEECVVDQGMYFASEGGVEVSITQQKNIATGLFGGEGFFQVSLKGTGWVVLHTPVPLDEIQKN